MKAKSWVWTAGAVAAGAAALAWLLCRNGQEDECASTPAGKKLSPLAAGPPKRFFRSPDPLRQAMDYHLNHPDEVKMVFQGKRVSKSFMRRIMLAIIGVNGCSLCRLLCARMDCNKGLTCDEMQALVNGDLSYVPPAEAKALAFAVHYAETGGAPDAEMVSGFEAEYGTDTARDILTVIRLVSFCNLCANTLGALVSRWQSQPAPESSLRSELATAALILAGILPYSIAMAFRVAVADTPDSVRSNVLVLQR